MQAVLTTRERDTLDILDGPHAGQTAPEYKGTLLCMTLGDRVGDYATARYRIEQDETGRFYRHISRL
jgi:hypothetical protein